MMDAADNLILLVDDDSMACAVRKLVLESHGHKVLGVRDAESALGILRVKPVRLVIIDYFLPGTNGIEVAAQMRQVKPEVPILLLSGSTDTPPGIEVVDGYLSKLEPVAVIEAKIMELLRRQDSGEDAED